MTVSARRIALDALVRIEDGAYAHIAVPRMLDGVPLERRDRALVTELTYGTVRMRRALDAMLGAVSSRRITDLDPPVRAALRLGAFQLATGVAPHAAVGETVEVTPARARGYVNGVLRALARKGSPWGLPEGDDVESTAIRTSHPDWVVRMLVDELGRDDARATLDVDNEPAAVTLRVNRALASVDAVAQELTDAGVGVARGGLVGDALVLTHPGDVAALPPVVDGRATPQDQSSQAVVELLDPQPGERVLDVAAAPGGKATGAAALVGTRGAVVAADLHPARVRVLARSAQRQHLDNVLPMVADGRRLPLPDAAFDRVLLDAPCSGLGVLRRRPDARWRVTPDDVETLATLQRELLAEAARVVRPGGRLVYSVCTLTRAETVEVDEWAAHHLPELAALPAPGAPWRAHGRGALLVPSAVRSDGMFVVVLERSRYPAGT